MATTRRRLAFTLPLMVASLALAAPAGAQFAHGPAFNQVRAVERVQFRDFWDDRGWSNRNNSPGSFWGDRRPSYPNRSYDPYTPYRRQQVYESIKPPAARKTETPPAETVVVIGDLLVSGWRMGLNRCSRKRRKLASCARSRRISVWFATMRDWTHPNGCKPSKTCCRRPKKPTPLL